MKKFASLFLLLAIGCFIYTSCDKVDALPFHNDGEAPVLSSDKTTIAPTATDSNNVAVTFSWTNPKYSTDSGTYKYVIEIDSADRNFSKKVTRTVTGTRSTSFLAKEINEILIGFGFAFNTEYNVDVRVVSSYPNNNEQYASNVLKMKMTAYKIPPKVLPPTTNELFIVGNATPGMWDNPVPTPNQKLVRMDSVTYGAVLELNAGGQYLLLPVNTNVWTAKYGVMDNTLPGLSAGGEFGFRLDPDPNFNQNFPGPATAGWYRMIYDFQGGRFTVTEETNPFPQELYITGDATAGGWSNAPPVNQKFTRLTNGEYEITIALEPGKLYKFLSVSGQWQPQFGGPSATGGPLGANYGGGQDPDNIPTPATAGTYKIKVNFLTNTYTVTN
jgi:hypothetical protein